MNRYFSVLLMLLSTVNHAIAQDVSDSAKDYGRAGVADSASLFTEFSCIVKDHNKVELHWAADSVDTGNYFIVERSNDGNRFDTCAGPPCIHLFIICPVC